MSEKRDNQRDKILTWLRMRGERGVLNTELTELCMRFGARIHELRKAGYAIKTIKLDESRYRFVLADPLPVVILDEQHGAQPADLSHAVQERLFA